MTEDMPPTPHEEEEARRLDRGLFERVLDKAGSDPAWKRRLLDEPEATMGEFPEYHRLRQMHESGATPTQEEEAAAPSEAMATPPPKEEYLRLKRSMLEKMLDKAGSDPAWKRRLLDEPKAALREADFPETRKLIMLQEEEEAEVRGQIAPGDYDVLSGPHFELEKSQVQLCTSRSKKYYVWTDYCSWW